MGLRDKAKSGLIKRMAADGIPVPMAQVFAEADYPPNPWPARLPRPVVDPKRAGQIIDTALNASRGGDMGLLMARVTEPDGGALARTRFLALGLYGWSASDLANRAFGRGTSTALGLD